MAEIVLVGCNVAASKVAGNMWFANLTCAQFWGERPERATAALLHG